MSASIKRQSCLLHPEREAAARCMGCGQSFCRECVTEHDLRMLCAACLRNESGEQEKTPRRRLGFPTTAVQILFGLALIWFTVYLAGRILVSTPTDFHEGSIWESTTP